LKNSELKEAINTQPERGFAINTIPEELGEVVEVISYD